MRFDLDFYKFIDYKLMNRLEKVQTDCPDIFSYSHSRQFKLFGEPQVGVLTKIDAPCT